MRKLFALLAFTMICLSVEAQNATNDDVAQKASLVKSYANSSRGFVDLSVGYLSGFSFQFTGSYGYQFGDYFYLGGGLGLMYQGANRLSLPIFANPRVYFAKGKIRPFFDLKAGYTIALNSANYGLPLEGAYLNPSVGVESGRFSCSVASPMVFAKYRGVAGGGSDTYSAVMVTVTFNF